MFEVEVKVVVQVDNDGNEPKFYAEEAAREAVENALNAEGSRGFEHNVLPMASVSVVSVEVS